jgi:hypothetical protein
MVFELVIDRWIHVICVFCKTDFNAKQRNTPKGNELLTNKITLFYEKLSSKYLERGKEHRVTSPNFPYFRLDKGIIGELNKK